MPKIELPSGKWVEYRDSLMADDQWAVQESFTAKINPDGSQSLPGGITSIMRRAFLGQIITAWGGPGLDGILIPADSPDGPAIIGKVLDIDDYNALGQAVQPLFEKAVPAAPNQPRVATTPSSSS